VSVNSVAVCKHMLAIVNERYLIMNKLELSIVRTVLLNKKHYQWHCYVIF